MKGFITLIMLFSFSLLIACTSNTFDGDVLIEQNTNKDLDFDVMNLLADQLGVWDVTINNDTIEDIEIVVDHYKHGEKQEAIIQMSTMFDQTKNANKVNLVIAEQTYHEESKWTAAIIDDSGIASTETFAPNMEDFASKAYSTAGVPDTAEIGESFVIGTIILTNSEDTISTAAVFAEDFSPEQIEAYDHTYIMTLQVN